MCSEQLPREKEKIEYRGDLYTLISYPLDSLFEIRKDIYLEIQDDSLQRGYKGFWKLENNCLYLISIESLNHTLFDIFKTNDPVLADWYSGTLEIGIHEFVFDEWNIKYGFYLWMKLEKGLVIEKRIVDKHSQFELDDTLGFGKYKNNTLNEVLKGKVNISINHKSLFKDYISAVINFLLFKNFDENIYIPEYNFNKVHKISLVSNEVASYIEINQKPPFSYLLTENFLAIENKFKDFKNVTKISEQFSKALEEILVSDFRFMRLLMKNDNDKISECTSLINPDKKYIEWAIKNVDDFSVPPHTLINPMNEKCLRKFDIKRLNSSIFEYEPIIENCYDHFNQQLIQLNSEKFLKKWGLIFDEANNIYFHDTENTEIFNGYRYFLDESYIVEKCKRSYNDEDESNNDWKRDYFDAMTDGQYGDYNDFVDDGGNIDDIDTWVRG